MIKYFETLNFKSIKSLHLPMRPFMVLVGPNGAGKTNVVRALELFGAMISRGTIDPVLEQGYYQLIHREKKPARGGMSFSVRIDLPQEIVERSMPVRFIGQRVQKSLFREEMAPLGTVQVEFGLALSGSVSSGDVRVSQESLTLTAEGAFASVRVKGGIVDVADESDKRLNWMIGRAILGTALSASLERSGSDLKSAIQGAFEVEEGAEGLLRLLNWQRLLAPWTRYIGDAVRVVRLRLDSSVLRGDSSFEEASRGPLGPNGEGLAIAVARLRGQRKRPTDDFMRVLSGLQRVFPRIEDVSTESTQPGRVILTFRERGISEALGPTNVF